MELEEAIEKVNKIRLNFYDKQYKKSYTDDELADICDSLSTILQYIEYDSIPKKTVEDKMKKLRQEALEVHSVLIKQTKKEYDYMLYKHYLDLIQQIKILRELLEDKNE